MRCLEENTLFDYIHDGLDAAARDAIGVHAASCDACRRLIVAAVSAAPSEEAPRGGDARELAETRGAGADASDVLGRTGMGDAGEAHGAGPMLAEAATAGEAQLGATRTRRPTPGQSDAPVVAASGRVIADKYRLVRLLGAGGMGTVHEAVNTWTGRRVAVKELRGVVASDATAVQRFTREAQSASRIAHPNVVDILDLGQDPATGALFMVQELLSGETLRQRMAVRGALSLDEVVRLIAPAVTALAVAHEAGVAHRDVKPDNLFLARDALGAEVTKVIDFGLSKLLRPDGDDLALTEHGKQMGTPFYMSPEQLRGGELDEQTDVWSIGVVLFEALAGARPFPGPSYNELVVQILKEPIPSLAAVAPAVPPAFATLIARALVRERSQRVRMRALSDALDELARRPEVLDVPRGNPYRGLLPFEAAHRGVFFGRAAEIAAVVARLERARFVLVAGDAGVGKSSLVRAGVVPALGEARIVTLVPGREPVRALAAALAPVLDDAVEVIAARLVDEPAAIGARLAGQGVVIVVDQLEELVVLGDPGDAAALATALWVMLSEADGPRVIATVRSDFLGRLAALPGLGDEVTEALYLLKPLTDAARREAIVGPARVLGARFESQALVDALAAERELPLLAFALAQLWAARDGGELRAAHLAALGGVAGALARHADAVLAELAERHRALARHALIALVTDDGTRARRTLAELAVGAPEPEALGGVLDALVRGELVILDASAETVRYALAHDALIDGWDTLRGWRGHAVERSAVRQRLARAAAEWARLGRPREALWAGRPLVEARELAPEALPAREGAFLAASRGAARRRSLMRRAMAVGIPLLIGVGFAGARWSAHRRTSVAIEAHVAAADAAVLGAATARVALDGRRAEAFAAFDRRDPATGEAGWARVRAQQAALDGAYRGAAEHLEAALALDGSRPEVRRRFAALLFDRAVLAERAARRSERDELAHRMLAYDDDGAQRARWTAPARVRIVSTPAGAAVSVRGPDGALRQLGTTPVDVALAQGGYDVGLTLGARAVRTSIEAPRGEALALEIPMPAAVPEGYVYVPPGRFLYGSTDDEEVRRTMLNAQPQHAVATPGYLIARHEVTFGEWLAYVRTLAGRERVARLPRTPNQTVATQPGAFLEVTEPRPGAFALTLQPTTRAYRGDSERATTIHYEARGKAADQPWLRMPVSAVSWHDARAYAAWLDRTGALPGARPCDEHEWERAARGADGRMFPTGDFLPPADADVAETYGRVPEAFGPDEVGSHAASDSPHGVADLAGNAWEWAASVSGAEEVVIRGGSWYHNPLAARSNNREPSEPALRAIVVGIRICANLSTR